MQRARARARFPPYSITREPQRECAPHAGVTLSAGAGSRVGSWKERRAALNSCSYPCPPRVERWQGHRSQRAPLPQCGRQPTLKAGQHAELADQAHSRAATMAGARRFASPRRAKLPPGLVAFGSQKRVQPPPVQRQPNRAAGAEAGGTASRSRRYYGAAAVSSCRKPAKTLRRTIFAGDFDAREIELETSGEHNHIYRQGFNSNNY